MIKFLTYVGLYALLVIWITLMVWLLEWKYGSGLVIGLSVGYGANIHSWLERKIKTEL